MSRSTKSKNLIASLWHRAIAVMGITTLMSAGLAYCQDQPEDPLSVIDGFFQAEERTTPLGEKLYTFYLVQPSASSFWPAPLDADPQDTCQALIDTISTVLPISDGEVLYHCSKPAMPRQGTAITLALTPGQQWHIKALEWYNGRHTLHASFEDTKALSRQQLTKMRDLQNTLTHLSPMGEQDFHTATAATPSAALWQWLAGSYKTLGNGALASWHSYEVISHSLHIVGGIQAHQWGALTLDLLSTLFHTLEGMEHAHHAGLGEYIHTDFHGDIVDASPYPHVANISLASGAFALNIIELLHGHSHGHGRLHTLMEVFHTGLHVYELGDALYNWWYEYPAHEHTHAHSREPIRLPASYRGQK